MQCNKTFIHCALKWTPTVEDPNCVFFAADNSMLRIYEWIRNKTKINMRWANIAAGHFSFHYYYDARAVVNRTKNAKWLNYHVESVDGSIAICYKYKCRRWILKQLKCIKFIVRISQKQKNKTTILARPYTIHLKLNMDFCLCSFRFSSSVNVFVHRAARCGERNKWITTRKKQ